MAAPKGHRPPGGSRKGRPNKVTADLKAMILAALSKVGGEYYLAEQAEKNPSAFLALIGKVLPIQMNTNLTLKEDPEKLTDAELAYIARSGSKRAVEPKTGARRSLKK